MKGKNIIVGVSGGIAAYKAAELVRLLIKEEIFTQVAMTPNAVQFVTPLTFEALSGNKVMWDMFKQESPDMEHISWGQNTDLIIIAPATANFIAKMAYGMGDDFLSTMVMAATAKIMVCPAMNTQMFKNPAVQDNIRTLKNQGIMVMDPEEGKLACRTEGPGRLPEPEDILEQAKILLTPQDLSEFRFLVTAGATHEPMDPVRFITNRSTGKMGYAIARAAVQRGAEVTLVSGPSSLRPPNGIKFCPVKTAQDMQKAVMENLKDCNAVIKAAAVSDYRPNEVAEQKIKKGAETMSLELVKNPDILAQLGEMKKNAGYLLVGFAAETESLLNHATEKLTAKNLDMIVANDVSRKDAGFEANNNIVKMIFRDGTVEDTPLMSKDETAHQVLDRVKRLLDHPDHAQ